MPEAPLERLGSHSRRGMSPNSQCLPHAMQAEPSQIGDRGYPQHIFEDALQGALADNGLVTQVRHIQAVSSVGENVIFGNPYNSAVSMPRHVLKR